MQRGEGATCVSSSSTGDLITGVGEIDDQHRHLLHVANTVIHMSDFETNETTFRKALSFLTQYILFHFAAEELAMKRSDFPRFGPHRNSHERFRKEAFALVRQAEKAGVTKDVKLKLHFILEDWLLQHVRIMDGDIAKYLRTRVQGSVVRLPEVLELKAAGELDMDFDDAIVRNNCDIF